MGPSQKYMTRAFNSVENAYLDAIEPYIGDKRFFVSGPEHKILKLRPREIFGLILISHVRAYLSGGEWVPGTDPFGHDGVVVRINDKTAGSEGRVHEQVFVPEFNSRSANQTIEDAVLEAVRYKADKGEVYRANTDLIVFVNRTGIIDNLRGLADTVGKLGYDTVYMIAHSVVMDSDEEIEYLCVILNSPVDTRGPLRIRINRKTGAGQVERVMR